MLPPSLGIKYVQEQVWLYKLEGGWLSNPSRGPKDQKEPSPRQWQEKDKKKNPCRRHTGLSRVRMEQRGNKLIQGSNFDFRKKL